MKVKKKIESALTAEDYLKRPYTRTIVREEDGSWRAEIAEFPGCIAAGDTDVEALSSLNDVALGWLESMLATGQSIPEPMENNDFSGKLVLRLPRSLHKKASFAAERDGVSLNQFIVSCVAEHVGMRSAQQAPAVASPLAPVVWTQFVSFHPTTATSFTASAAGLARVTPLDSAIRLPVHAYGR